MGSGTTGVVAKKLNRNFIGVELDNIYFQIAKKRINAIKTLNNIEEYTNNSFTRQLHLTPLL